MVLKKIKIDLCPYCKSEAVIEERTNLNKGNCTEIKGFDCGLELCCRNGETEIIETKKCPSSDEYKKIATSRIKAFNKLYQFIEDLDVDNDFKAMLRTEITSIID